MSLDLIERDGSHRHLAIAFLDTDLDIFGPSLHDLQQALYSQLNRLLSCHIVLVILLQEFADGLRGTTDRGCFPCTIDSTRLCLVQPWPGIMRVEPDNKRRNTERANTPRLCVALGENVRAAAGTALVERTCWMPAMCRVMYSTVTGSSTVRR
jgi:hypothetical protein